MNNRKRTITGTIRRGGNYVYHEQRLVKREGERVVEDLEGAAVRVVAFAYDAISRRDTVVFLGLEDVPETRWYTASLNWFALHYRELPVKLSEAELQAAADQAEQDAAAVAAALAAGPPPERVAGQYSSGAGV